MIKIFLKMNMSKNNPSENREEWLERMKKEGKLPEDKKEDHRRMSRALENPTRREIMKYIGANEQRTIDEIKKEFDIHESQVKMHLDFLEQGLVIEKKEKEDKTLYQLTPRGEGHLENMVEG